ncbi:unnamed protein product [Auanema sp. JU1783]|nr:unnamed protein product [Auanema sp. JU1783]
MSTLTRKDDISFLIDKISKLEEKIENTERERETDLKLKDLIEENKRKEEFIETFKMNHTNIPNPTKLKTKLKEFDGEITEYPEFIGIFRMIVDENPMLSQLEKFYHLRSCLTGKAGKVIKHLKFTEENYVTSLQLLQRTYDRPNERKRELKIKFKRIPRCAKNIENMKETFHDVRIIIEALKEFTSIDNSDIIETVLEKFPQHIIREICKIENRQGSELGVERILKIIDEAISTEEYLYHRIDQNNYDMRPSMNFMAKLNDDQSQNRANYNSGRVNIVTDKRNGPLPFSRRPDLHGTSEKLKGKYCIFCNKTNHTSIECKKRIEVYEKREIVRKERVCWICFSKNHNSYNCKEPKCKSCNDAHHDTLCSKRNLNFNTWNSGNNLSNKYANYNETKPTASGGNAEPLNENFRSRLSYRPND